MAVAHRDEVAGGEAQPQCRRLVGQRHPIGERVVEDGGDGAAMGGDEGQPRTLFADADGNGDRAEPLQGEQHEAELRTVREQHQDPVAGAEA